MYRTRKSQGSHPDIWNVEVRSQIRGPRAWRAVGHVKRVMWEHYLAYCGGVLLGSTETRRDAVKLIVSHA